MSSKMTPEQEAKQRAQITAWQEEGATKEANNKRRNHILIQLGLALLDMTKKDKLSIQDAIRHVEIAKQDMVKSFLEENN